MTKPKTFEAIYNIRLEANIEGVIEVDTNSEKEVLKKIKQHKDEIERLLNLYIEGNLIEADSARIVDYELIEINELFPYSDKPPGYHQGRGIILGKD